MPVIILNTILIFNQNNPLDLTLSIFAIQLLDIPECVCVTTTLLWVHWLLEHIGRNHPKLCEWTRRQWISFSVSAAGNALWREHTCMILGSELAVKTQERGLWAIVYSSMKSPCQCAAAKKSQQNVRHPQEGYGGEGRGQCLYPLGCWRE